MSVPVLRPAHRMAGRARYRLDRDLPDVDVFAGQILRLSGVRRVAVRPATLSVIVEFDGSVEAFEERLAHSDVAQLKAPLKPPPLDQVFQLGIVRADEAVRDRTAGALDLHSAVGLILLAGACVQLARGQVAGPASALLLGALPLLERGRKSS